MCNCEIKHKKKLRETSVANWKLRKQSRAVKNILMLQNSFIFYLQFYSNKLRRPKFNSHTLSPLFGIIKFSYIFFSFSWIETKGNNERRSKMKSPTASENVCWHSRGSVCNYKLRRSLFDIHSTSQPPSLKRVVNTHPPSQLTKRKISFDKMKKRFSHCFVYSVFGETDKVLVRVQIRNRFFSLFCGKQQQLGSVIKFNWN